MNSNKKNSAKEPAEAYEVTPKVNCIEEELDPVLVKLIEKSKQEHEQGLGFSNEEAMRRIKARFPFLK